MRASLSAIVEPNQRQQLVDPIQAFGPTPVSQTKPDVFRYRQVRKECVVLKHHPYASMLGCDPMTRPGHQIPVQADLSTGGGQESGDGSQDRCLAASRRSKHAANLPARQFQRQSPHHRVGRPRELHGELVELEKWHECE